MGNQFASDKELLILRLLISQPEGMYGLELIRASDEKLKRGTVYVTLGRMEEKGFVKSRVVKSNAPSHAGLPRPLYTVTAKGTRVLSAAELMGLQIAEA
jgi:DNA-binding PadR family transcriptional regulator